MAIGKLITLYLIDGSVNGVIACELFNWTGKGYKIPRNLLKGVSDREELRKAGVYFLLGHDASDQPLAYIGEAEDVYKRLTQHQGKDFWTEALAFVSKDDNLNKAHVKYLEYELFREAKEASRFEIANDNTPNRPGISEAERSVMLEFAENLRVMVGTLGYRVFEPLAKRRAERGDVYLIEATRGASAKGVLTNEGFVVLKGSHVAESEVPSTPQAVKAKRAALMTDGAISAFVLCRDILFSSPSIAAAVVLGRSANGLIEWKLKDGSTLRDAQAPDGGES